MHLLFINRKLGYDYLCTFVFSIFITHASVLIPKQKLYVLGPWYQYV